MPVAIPIGFAAAGDAFGAVAASATLTGIIASAVVPAVLGKFGDKLASDGVAAQPRTR